jgi:hypothetical protein
MTFQQNFWPADHTNHADIAIRVICVIRWLLLIFNDLQNTSLAAERGSMGVVEGFRRIASDLGCGATGFFDFVTLRSE